MLSQRLDSMIAIRQEKKEDREKISDVIEMAFRNVEISDHSEHFLVERLRKSDTFIPELSLVAELDGALVGHILLTRIEIVDKSKRHTSLALAPVSVVPEHQKRGIGGGLIITAHDKARVLGYGAVVLLGHKDYYPRFGYKMMRIYGIQLPFDAPEENCMIVELKPNALDGVHGTIEYPKAFFE